MPTNEKVRLVTVYEATHIGYQGAGYGVARRSSTSDFADHLSVPGFSAWTVSAM